MIKKDKTVRIAPDAVVVGDVTIEENSSVWYHTTIRAEDAQIHIGPCCNIQDNCVLHVDEDGGIELERNVTVGHGVIMHDCCVGENTLIGMGSIIISGAKIGKNCLIGAGSLVTGNTVIPDNTMAFGNPARVQRPITEAELAHSIWAADDYRKKSIEYEKNAWYLTK